MMGSQIAQILQNTDRFLIGIRSFLGYQRWNSSPQLVLLLGDFF